jgi:hypothetical protein
MVNCRHALKMLLEKMRWYQTYDVIDIWFRNTTDILDEGSDSRGSAKEFEGLV